MTHVRTLIFVLMVALGAGTSGYGQAVKTPSAKPQTTPKAAASPAKKEGGLYGGRRITCWWITTRTRGGGR